MVVGGRLCACPLVIAIVIGVEIVGWMDYYGADGERQPRSKGGWGIVVL